MMVKSGGKNRDAYFLKHCMHLAEKGRGYVSPNPLVGAVIVKNNTILGEGWHAVYGGPHAEVNAFRRAARDVSDATLYCNLEPCCHVTKQTPPCTPLIISKRIRRVVVSNLDPNPQVAGEGLRQLQRAGIDVEHGQLVEEGEYLNRFYFKHTRTGQPYVTVKIAQSLDGKISVHRDGQTWITGEESRRFVHGMRASYDAVCVGAGTVKADNPALTVRQPEGRNPVRIIIDGSLSVPLSAQVASDLAAPTWLMISPGVPESVRSGFNMAGVTLIEGKQDTGGKLDLAEALMELGRRNITSLLVEGGQELFSQFIRQKLFDDVVIFQHPVFLGRGLVAVKFDRETELEVYSVETIGDDIKLECRKKASLSGEE